jgi:hypothetical protein
MVINESPGLNRTARLAGRTTSRASKTAGPRKKAVEIAAIVSARRSKGPCSAGRQQALHLPATATTRPAACPEPGLAFVVAEPAGPMLGLVHHAVVAAMSFTVAPITGPLDSRDYSATDQQAHQRGANYGSGPMPHDGARPSSHPRSPSLPLYRGFVGGRLATRLGSAGRAPFGGAWLIRCAHHYLLLLLLPSPHLRTGNSHDPLTI